MKILFFQWNAFMQRGIEKALNKLGVQYDTFFYIFKDWDKEDGFVDMFATKIKSGGYDAVFSVNFAPLIAEACDICGVEYISWVYDCPLHIRRTDTIGLPNNKVFFFDRSQVEKYSSMGMNTVYHMPLAVDTEIFLGAAGVLSGDLGAAGTSGTSLASSIQLPTQSPYACDVSLVGQLYKSEFDYLCSPLDEYSRGYLEGLVKTQMQLSGGYILNEMITAPLMDMLNEQYNKASKGTFQVQPAELEYTLACEATGRERFMALALLQNRCDVKLYSKDNNETLNKVKHMGYVDYYSVMPKVFAGSRINLNISLKAIASGIPLRVLDIMGSGGFVMSNLQPELLEHFEPGYDIVIYEDIKDLVEKVQYYLANEEARLAVARRGLDKVKELFTFEDRLKKMLGMTSQSSATDV